MTLNLEIWGPWLGTMQYYFKGAVLAHPTSPKLSAPRVSTLISQSAVGLDMVNPGVILIGVYRYLIVVLVYISLMLPYLLFLGFGLGIRVILHKVNLKVFPLLFSGETV